MKIVILVVSFFMMTIEVYATRRQRQFMEQCLNENELTKEQWNQMRKNKDPKVGCIHACMMIKENLMTKEGVVNKDRYMKRMTRVLSSFPEDKVKEYIDTCVSEVNNLVENCEKALAMKNCLTTKKPTASEPTTEKND